MIFYDRDLRQYEKTPSRCVREQVCSTDDASFSRCHGPTDGWIDQQTDIPSYRDAVWPVSIKSWPSQLFLWRKSLISETGCTELVKKQVTGRRIDGGTNGPTNGQPLLYRDASLHLIIGFQKKGLIDNMDSELRQANLSEPCTIIWNLKKVLGTVHVSD